MDGIAKITPAYPHCAERLEKERAYDVRSHADGQHDSSDPVDGYPRKVDAKDRKERSRKQDDHASRCQPVQQAIGQRMPDESIHNLLSTGLGRTPLIHPG